MPPILKTSRLLLRTPLMTDLEHIYRLGRNPRVMQFITGTLNTMEDARRELNRRLRTADEPLGYWITEEKITEDFVGWMGLKVLEKTGEIEIGYRFLEEHWGKGYATEAGQKVLDYAFVTLNLKKVVAVAKEENRASTRVMEKLGMQFAGRGFYYDTYCVCYRVLREDYLANKRLLGQENK